MPKPEKPAVKVELPPGEYDEEGSVIIFDREGSGSLEVFGSNNEFEAFVEKVKTLGVFPVLSSLMLAVARDAKEADSTVMLYFDPEV